MTGSKRLYEVINERFVWGILIGGALLLRAVFATSRMVLAGDEMHYAESLHRFMGGRIMEGLSDYWSFLYPFAAVPFGFLYGDAEAGLRLLSVLSGAVLLTTGDTFGDEAEEVLARTGLEVLSKPFDLDELRRRVRARMAGS